ncbi:hypothetical protein HOI83_02465, partial [Candidatus Uhrbacteria bacterium]|nr:hypothetical protein [Candidatus Uhrbacteria bacterium]
MEEKIEKPSESDILSNLPFIPTSVERPHDFGVLVDDQFLYWDARLDIASRNLRTARDRVNKLITIVAGIATVLLFILFGVSTFALLPSSMWGTLSYWTSPSTEQLFFWLGVGGLLYIGY